MKFKDPNGDFMGSNHEKGDQPSIGSLDNQLTMGRVTGMPWENLETDTGNYGGGARCTRYDTPVGTATLVQPLLVGGEKPYPSEK